MNLPEDTLEKLCILRRRHLANKTPLRVYIDEERELLMNHAMEKDSTGRMDVCFVASVLVFVVSYAIYITYSFSI